MNNNYLGEIRMFGGNFAPKGWALCNGQLMAISQNSALFSLLGTNFGGNGTSNFALPNLQSRAPIHWGTGPGLSQYVIGEQIGTENVTLLQTEMPMHNHVMKAVSSPADQAVPTNFYNSAIIDPVSGSSTNSYSDAAPGVTMNPNAVGLAGGSQPHSNLQPLLAVTFIIALQGIFPSRTKIGKYTCNLFGTIHVMTGIVPDKIYKLHGQRLLAITIIASCSVL